MTKTRTNLKITISAFCILLFAFCICFAISSVPASAETVSATEATDVYWYVAGDKLLLSPEQGNTGFQKWSKESIAAVRNEADVPWNSNREDITSVIIYSTIAPPSTAFWFKDTGLTSFSVTGEGTVCLDLSYATDVSRMFAGCSKLTTLDLSDANAPLVNNIESAFDGCSSIKALDISCFDGAPISNMMNAFYGCAKLEALDVSGLDISRVTDFTGVFYGCAALKSLDLSELDGRKLTTLADSFYGCAGLASLTFGNGFTCENVTDMANTFRECKSLTSLDIGRFSTSKVTDMSRTFASCEALEELILGQGFVCSSVTNMENMFASCKAIKTLDTTGWGAVKVKNMNSLFSYCTSLESLNLAGFTGAAPEQIRAMFDSAESLKTVDLSMLDTSSVTTLYGLFEGCASLEEFDLSSINISKVTDLEYAFSNCTSLVEFSFVGADTSRVERMSFMFSGCNKLERVDFSGIDSSKVIDMDNMFERCSALQVLDLSDFDVAEGLSSSSFIRNCSMLGEIKAPKTIPESVSISLSYLTFYTGEKEITELTSENQNKTLARKFDIGYYWKKGTQTTRYELEPTYYYYGYGASITATVSENGYVFDGWTRGDSDVAVTEITTTDTGAFKLYAKLIAHQPVVPVISSSADVAVTYGEGFDVNISFAEDEYHNYWIEWYRTTWRESSGGVQVSGLRNTRGFTIDPKHFEYGITIEEEVYFYCTVKVTRKDNGLEKTVSSPSIRVYVERAQAEITVHPTAIEGLVYNGSPQAVATLGESNFGEVTYGFYLNSGFSTGENKQTNAGVGILYYRVSGGTYYKGTETYELEYKIEAATPAVSWNTESQTVDYTGEEAVIAPPSVLLLNADTYNGTVSYSYTGTSSGTGLPVNAGTYSVIASIAAEGNYKAASSEALTLVINKVEPEFSVEPGPIEGLIYNGGEQALASLGETLGGVVEFSLDQSSWSSNVPKGKNAGEYTVYYKIKGDNNHVDGVIGSFKASIGKKNVTVIAEDKTICVNSAYTLTYKLDGFVDGEALPIEITLSTDATVGAAGDYGIAIDGAAASGNYTFTYENGTLTVRDHAYDSGAVTTTPTCTAGGEMTYTCLHDVTHFYTEPIPIDENAHAWNSGVVTIDPTCSAPGTKVFTCTHNGEHTKTEDVAIDVNAHAWNEGVVTKQPTCTENGVKNYTCTHNSEHTKTEEVNALGHVYDNACDTDCNICAEARTPAEHPDANDDRVCDECGAELPREGLSGGAIAAIAIGSAVVAGLGGFSIFWFVIRKKTWADLIKVFKKN